MQIRHERSISLSRSSLLPYKLRMRLAAQQMERNSTHKLTGRQSFLQYADPGRMPVWKPSSLILNDTRIVWTYWDKGFEKAPDIVRVCADSLKRQVNNARLIFLTDETLHDYITLPDFIREKWERINPTKRGDLIRLELLAQHGGVWLDATCFLTAPLPEVIFSLDQYFPPNHGKDRLIRSWFLVAKKRNPVFVKLLRMHYAFYRENIESEYYFFLHYMFECLCMTDQEAYRRFIGQYRFDPSLETDDCHNFLLGRLPELDREAFRKCIILKNNWKEATFTPGRKEILLDFLDEFRPHGVDDPQ